MSKTNNIGSFGVALFLIGTVAFSIFVFSSFLSAFNHAKESSHWPQVTGVVVENSRTHGEGGTECVCYEYLIGQKTYHGCQGKFFQPDALSKGQIGETVRVFYNPANPQDACLVPGVSSITTARIFIFLTVLSGGVVFTLYSLVQIVLPKKNGKSGGTRVDRERVPSIPNLFEWSHN